jgi:hypothetical protein
MSKPVVLGIAPRFDEASQYSYKWFMNLFEKTNEDVEFDLLVVDFATREEVEKKLSIKKYDIILFYDHGDENGLVAQGGQSYVLDKNNLELTKSSCSFIYTLACLAGKGYGTTAWQKGIVFIGYTDVFGFTTEEEELFEEAAGAGFKLWAKGERNIKIIKEFMISKFEEGIKKAKSAWTKIWLTHDKEHLVAYDSEAPSTSTCTFRKIALKLFGPRGWKLRSIKLFKNLYWYDLWHMLLGLIAGLLRNTVWGFLITLVYFIYQITEKERDVQTLRDLAMYLYAFMVTMLSGLKLA